ncbi:hypothetical protein L1987_59914 [Smallanthus sonchifolius]|uniref:Uncharacterized protein n=1 Tax=Smallanthus sonchifolius TaxID=185202 RepID=A0ACB9D6M2_9ASTR|nr:hypothetical protein L1987_59914 [Smallanthus sonchifolius]
MSSSSGVELPAYTSSSYGIIERVSKTFILLNAGPGDRVDLILDYDFMKKGLTLQPYYEGLKTVLFKDHGAAAYKVLRMIFRTNNWELVTARSNASGQVLDHKSARHWAGFALWCELKFLLTFEKSVKINRLRKENIDDEGNICVICYEEHEDGVMITTLECKHGYHVECIKNSLMYKFSCPLCRYRVFHTPIILAHSVDTNSSFLDLYWSLFTISFGLLSPFSHS